MSKVLRIGTRDSQLAVWQATLVQDLLKEMGVASELVYMKSEGDIDTVTPLYALGVTGVFTKTLDAALLNNRIDIAVHSMKDVPTQLAQGIQQTAVLKRASHKDILVYKNGFDFLNDFNTTATIATGSIRRIAQWLHRYPNHTVENLRGNVNTRLRKLKESSWQGAIFAAAGLERIQLRPENSVDLDWMLPAPSQGAIMIVCRDGDDRVFESCQPFNDEATALCTKIEKDFLRLLMGGCSTPISALAQIENDTVVFRGNICSTDGVDLIEVMLQKEVPASKELGEEAARQILTNDKTKHIIENIRNGRG
ncbi:MAG TPA: hydroxymethylbilane synthase [Flavisolibacter sp.]|nr:hydroxymethylbilane synthase [Flavisolibacter sp.]